MMTMYDMSKWWNRRRFKKRHPGAVFIPKDGRTRFFVHDDATLMHGAVIYPGVEIHKDVLVAPYSQVREDTILMEGVKIGAKCNIEWGCIIGPRTNIQGLSMVPEKTVIGSECFLAQLVGMMTDKYMDGDCKSPRIGNRVKIGGNVQILPGAAIGDDCIIGAGCVIDGEIPPRSKVFSRAVKGEIQHRVTYPSEGVTRK